MITLMSQGVDLSVSTADTLEELMSNVITEPLDELDAHLTGKEYEEFYGAYLVYS